MGRPHTVDTGAKQRLLQFIEHKRLSKHRFETMCGFSSRYVSNIQKTISPLSMKKMSDVFPELNLHWLETGEGQMLNEVIPINVQNNTVGNNSQQTIFAGTEQKHSTLQEKGEYVLNEIRKKERENTELKVENASLKTKVEMLYEQIEWLKTLIKQ